MRALPRCYWALVACVLAAGGGAPAGKDPPPRHATGSAPAADTGRQAAIKDRREGATRKWEATPGGNAGKAGDEDRGGFNPSPEEIDRLLEFTRAHFPDVHKQLSQVQRDDPKAFRLMLKRVGPPMMHLMRMSRDNPKQAEQLIRVQKMEMQIRDARQRYRAARTDEARNAVRAELRSLVEQKFDARQQRLKSEIDDLRQRLDEQTRRYVEQADRRQPLIDEEVGRLFEAKPVARTKQPIPE